MKTALLKPEFIGFQDKIIRKFIILDSYFQLFPTYFRVLLPAPNPVPAKKTSFCSTFLSSHRKKRSSKPMRACEIYIIKFIPANTFFGATWCALRINMYPFVFICYLSDLKKNACIMFSMVFKFI